jgi:hypothetical protein
VRGGEKTIARGLGQTAALRQVDVIDSRGIRISARSLALFAFQPLAVLTPRCVDIRAPTADLRRESLGTLGRLDAWILNLVRVLWLWARGAARYERSQ